MIFLGGQHEGGDGQRVALKFTSFTVRGARALDVVIKDVIIDLQYATEICFDNVTLDHWNSTSPGPPFLVFQMLSVLAENQTYIFIEHATNSSGNKIKLVNTIFRNSSLSGRLSFIKSEWNAEACMSLISSTLKIGKNTNINFMHNLVREAVLFLNSSTLNLESNVHMAFISNSRAMAIFGSTLNVVADTNMSFIGNLKTGDEGAAMFVVRSTLNIEGGLHFINNSAYSQGAVNFQISTLNIRKCARIVFIDNLAKRQAGGILLENSVLSIEDNAKIAFIKNSAGKIGSMAMLLSTLHVRHKASLHFIGNSASTYGGSFEIELSTATIENNAQIIFTNNVADTAGGMALRSSILNITHNAQVLFDSNHAVVGGGALYALKCTINVENGAQMTFINNSAFSAAFVLVLSNLHVKNRTVLTFINNTAITFGGAFYSYKSTISIENATNRFINNSAANGGAMALLSSILDLVNGSSNLIFENNSAKEKGGAIYIHPDKFEYTLQVQHDNYYHLLDTCLYDTGPTSMEQYLYFVNNLAQIAGDDIYGASLEWCNVSAVHIHPKNNSSLSSVSGNPSRVCRCDETHKPLCHNISYNHYSLSYYPGEIITVSVVIVGGDWGATHGMVYAKFQPPNSSSTLKPSSQYNQWINESRCTSLNYSVYSNQSVQLLLSAISYSDITCDNNVTHQYYAKACTFFFPLHIDFTVHPCPCGFSLQGIPPGCSCYPVLTDNGVICNILKSEAAFSWNTSFWITLSAKKVILSKHCPFDYCKDTKLIKGVSDDQCSFNRAGRLCGGCKENYSLAIGSSHCIYCTNDNNVTLLIFFAAAGFLLVFFVSVLNLTITQGMINGLIFYGNIVWMYQSVLFPNEIPSELIFFKTFIAWLNLDFGIEMCFVNNLNAFWKSWLQFIFPFYLWSIAGLMIMLARYSSRLTTLFGSRAVPVLVTLILLSYMKLLRTAVEILHFSILTVIDYDNSNDTAVKATSDSLVWSIDGTLEYFGYPHILLFVAALFTLLFLWLPYTLLLLLIQWIRRVSHYRLLRWTIRLNPFYDANFAPLNHKHQYWFGLLLLVRGMIFVLFASNSFIPNDTNLLILLIFVGLLQFYMLSTSIYKSHAVLVFHSSFFLNLCFLSGFIIFSHTKGKVKSSMQTSATFISTGIAFLQFCGVILYQIYSLCCSCRIGRGLSNVRVHEDQVHAILDISSRLDHHKYSAEKQPLIDPNHSDEPTY
jgi:predicted outer membrane repeat protein